MASDIYSKFKLLLQVGLRCYFLSDSEGDEYLEIVGFESQIDFNVL